MENLNYDVAVIGGGAGGLFAASVAKALGGTACVIEKTRLGGDCTWFGCMPSKAILRSAEVARLIRESGRYGLTLPQGTAPDADGVFQHVADVVNEIAAHHEPEDLEKRGIKIIIGPPRFIGTHTVEVEGQRITAKRFVLCTGSHPVVPPIEGLKDVNYLTNETVFSQDRVPESLIVLGGGPIGCEMAQAFARLGSKVTLVELMDRIFVRDEPEFSDLMLTRFEKEGMDVFTGWKAVRFSRRGAGITAVLENKEGEIREIGAEKVLVAVGRAPNLDGLDLEKAGVEATNKGVKVNDHLQTSNPDIFACGDIASPYQFSHVAAYQAGVAVRNAMFKRIAWSKVSYENIAWATFTHPEIAHLGLTEAEAREHHGEVKVYTTPYTSSDRATTDGEKEGMLKVITDKKGYILGAHIIGAAAGEVIQGFIVAKSQKIKLSKLASSLFIYPTLSELVKKTAAKPLVEVKDNPAVKLLMKVLKAF